MVERCQEHHWPNLIHPESCMRYPGKLLCREHMETEPHLPYLESVFSYPAELLVLHCFLYLTLHCLM